MSSQIFRCVPDYNKVFSFLDTYCSRIERHFMVNDITYKQILYSEQLEWFYNFLRPYYHLSKRHYLNPKKGFAGLLTILRHLCKVYSIEYVSKVVYHHDIYTNTLIIYVDRENWEKQPEPTTEVINCRVAPPHATH